MNQAMGGAGAPKRVWADSRCAQPPTSPRAFHYYLSPSTHVRHEIVDAMYATRRTQTEVAGLIGDVFGRMRAASRGELRDAALLEPVRNDPELWELKWKVRKVGEYRLYHAEPEEGPPDLVALRFHAKDVSSGDQATIDAAQDSEIEVASKRYAEGVPRKWGHTRGCIDCLSD